MSVHGSTARSQRSVPNSAMKGYSYRQNEEEGGETLAQRRHKLKEKQKAWVRDVETDPDLAAMLANDFLDVNGQPTELELSMLYQSFRVSDGNDGATNRQLLQLLHAADPTVALYALKHITKRIHGNEMDVSHLAGAIKPLVKIILNKDRDAELYWAVLVVLQQLCIEDRHAMAIGDCGGPQALIELLDVPEKDQAIGAAAISNILNAIWLICCYEGNGDLAAYEDDKGPIASILSLLGALREEGTETLMASHKILKQEMMHMFGDVTGDDPVLILLHTISKMSVLKAYRGHLTAGGAIEQCVPLLQHEEVEHRVIAAHVITNLMVDNSLEFVVLDGIQKGVNLLGAAADPEVMAGLCLYLHLYQVRGDLTAMASDMVSVGCLRMCVGLLQREGPGVAAAAISLLGLICKHGSEDYSFLLSQEPGMIRGVTSLLRATHNYTLQQVTAMFWYLTRVGSTHQEFINAGTIPLLQRILKRSPDQIVRHNALGCLEKLECFDDLGNDFFAPPIDEQSIHW